MLWQRWRQTIILSQKVVLILTKKKEKFTSSFRKFLFILSSSVVDLCIFHTIFHVAASLTYVQFMKTKKSTLLFFLLYFHYFGNGFVSFTYFSITVADMKKVQQYKNFPNKTENLFFILEYISDALQNSSERIMRFPKPFEPVPRCNPYNVTSVPNLRWISQKMQKL